ncbi:MAG: flagellar biosynthesis protein FlhA, partial [Myxococcota bacterium]|nr:flagellar biosynthesis protein FlhA [Myxococcota bacterium]
PGAVEHEAIRRETLREAGARAAMIPLVVPVSIELGSALAAKLLDGRGGGVLVEDEIPSARDELFLALGVSVPAVRARESAALAPWGYAISLHEIPVAKLELQDADALTDAELGGVVARRLAREVRRRAADFVGLQEVQSMLDHLERASPALVRNVVPKPVPLALLTDVLRRLVREGVSIRTLREVLEALALHAPGEKDPAALAESVRASLRRHITHAHAQPDGLAVHLVDPMIEDAIRDAIQRTGSGASLALAPSVARDVLDSVRRASAAAEAPLVLLTQRDVRRFLRGLLEVELPDVVVLAHQDVDPDVSVRPLGRLSL